MCIRDSRKGEHVKFFNTGSEYDADEVGVLKLKMQPRDEIRAGDVGYICSGIKMCIRDRLCAVRTAILPCRP